MYIDIHRHTETDDENVLVLRNIFPDQLSVITDRFFYSIGLHPWYIIETAIENDLKIINEYAVKKNIIAVGETGLDKKVDISYLNQIKAFEKQIEIAERNNIPVIIHCVKAYDDLLTIRKKTNINIPWIIHWFNANEQIAGQLIEKNCYLSFGRSLFKETSKAFKTFKNLPPDKIFFETDDTEYSIKEVYKRASEILKYEQEKLKHQIKLNFSTCFNIAL